MANAKGTAREIALRALIEYRRRGAWPDLWLKKALEGLSPEDAGLATALVGGVVQRRMLLDFYIGQFSTVRPGKIEPQVLDILRMGVYQLVFWQARTPAYAVVNEAVGLARRHANPRAAGFVNSLLRTVSRQAEDMPQPGGDARERMAILHSHPRWLVDRVADRLGEDACAAFLEANNRPVPAQGWVNTLRISTEALTARLAERGIAATAYPGLEGAVTLDSLAGVGRWPELAGGQLYIMGAASQMCVHALAPQTGDHLLDLCAAPGGKTLLAALKMQGRGSLLAMDIHPHKTELLEGSARAYGFGDIIQTVAADATVFRPGLEAGADRIICDVPCSGLGVIGRKPDIRYKDPAAMAGLPAVQRAILDNAGRYLRPGGIVVYSTCTVLEEENEGVVAGFLRDNPGFETVAFELPGIGAVDGGMIQLWPQEHGTDGFFMAKIQKKA